jgi:hypothetical protein
MVAASSAGRGRAWIPPDPPLKLTRRTLLFTMTVRL